MRQNVTEKYSLVTDDLCVQRTMEGDHSDKNIYILLQSLPLIKHSEIIFTALAIPVDNYLEGFERVKQQKYSKTFLILYILWRMKIT